MNTGSRDERTMLNDLSRAAKALEGINASLKELTNLATRVASTVPAPKPTPLRGRNAQDDIATDDPPAA